MRCFVAALVALCAHVGDGPAWAQDAVDRSLARLADTSGRHVMVIAHRGHTHATPENSLAGLQSMIDAGADIVEVDVRQTADGELILMHDESIARTTTATGDVAQMTWPELRAVRLRDDSGRVSTERIPTLRSALMRAKGKILIQIDRKCERCAQDIFRVVRDTDTTRQVIVPARESRAATQAYYGDFGDAIFLYNVGDADPALVQRAREASAEMNIGLYAVGFSAFSEGLQARLNAAVKLRRIAVGTLDARRAGGLTDRQALSDPQAVWGELARSGAGIILTDEPEACLAFLRARGLHD